MHLPVLNYCTLPTMNFCKPSYTSPPIEIINMHPKCWKNEVIMPLIRPISLFFIIWWRNDIMSWSNIVPYEWFKPHLNTCQNMIPFWSRWRQAISYLWILVIMTTSLVIITQHSREHDLMPTSIQVYKLFMNLTHITFPSLPWMWPLQSES